LIATLDTKLQVRRVVRITRGTLDSSLVHPREVFRAAIADAAASILLIHNHPSGDPTPSSQDRDITKRLKEVGAIIGINVIDHIVVGQGKAISLAESN
jgi:DNA repair protein RadC